MRRLISLYWGVLLLVATRVPSSGQAADALAALLARNQFDLAGDGREFLLKEVNRASFLLVGNVHGDNDRRLFSNR
jgi:hypothetical protein